jgi:uncharacterized UBP type Zn finger protein
VGEGIVGLAGSTSTSLLPQFEWISELCTHLDEVELHELPPSVDGCEECLRDGGKWLHLRICLTCGHVGCCDDSPNRHATAHHHATSHPIFAA